jgi:hypothetical protein
VPGTGPELSSGSPPSVPSAGASTLQPPRAGASDGSAQASVQEEAAPPQAEQPCRSVLKRSISA